MRIALWLHGWPAAEQGGAGLYVEALARALVALGHAVATLAPVPGRAGEPATLVPLPPLPGAEAWGVRLPPPTRLEDTWTRPATDALVAGWLHRWRPDVVHVHHLAHASLGWLRAAREARATVALTLHDYALPCARGQLVDADLRPCPGPAPERCAACLGPHLRLSPLTAPLGRALAAAPRLRARARTLAATPEPGGPARLAARAAAVDRALALPHHLLSPSADLARRFAALGLRRPRHLDLPLIRPVALAPPPGDGPLRVLFASTVIPTKGPHRLVEALEGLPGATLTIAGPAPAFDGQPGYAAALRRRVEALPGGRWLGAVPPEAVPALLAAHDLLVLPSTWPENSPLIVREATAAGLRTVLPAEGGAAELDPLAVLVGATDEAGLRSALRAEIDRGRGRRPPLRWLHPEEHARALLGEVYAPVAGR